MPCPKPSLKIVVTHKLVEDYDYEVVISLVNLLRQEGIFFKRYSNKEKAWRGLISLGLHVSNNLIIGDLHIIGDFFFFFLRNSERKQNYNPKIDQGVKVYLNFLKSKKKKRKKTQISLKITMRTLPWTFWAFECGSPRRKFILNQIIMKSKFLFWMHIFVVKNHSIGWAQSKRKRLSFCKPQVVKQVRITTANVSTTLIQIVYGPFL